MEGGAFTLGLYSQPLVNNVQQDRRGRSARDEWNSGSDEKKSLILFGGWGQEERCGVRKGRDGDGRCANAFSDLIMAICEQLTGGNAV